MIRRKIEILGKVEIREYESEKELANDLHILMANHSDRSAVRDLGAPMQLKFVGYSYGEGRNNPDGSWIHDGLPLYESESGIAADGYWLIENGFQSGLGDNPEVPVECEHWFVKNKNKES